MSDDLLRPDAARDLTALVARYLAAVQDMDWTAVSALHTRDVVLEEMYHESGRTADSDLRRYTGTDEVARHLHSLSAVMHSLTLTGVELCPTADGASVYVDADGEAALVDGTRYHNHYLIRFDADGPQLCRISVFHNPVAAARPYGRTLPPGIVAAGA